MNRPATGQSLQQNADIVPPSLDVAGAAADLETLDNLVPVLEAWKQTLERLQDTVDALGSDALVVANQGFKLMKSMGKAQGLEEITKELSYRHAKPKRKKPKAEAEPAGESDSEE